MGDKEVTASHWYDCEDIRVLDDEGDIIYVGPKWLRCAGPGCGNLVTHGGFEQTEGKCPECGWRRVVPAGKLKPKEKTALKKGRYPLVEWEQRLINGH